MAHLHSQRASPQSSAVATRVIVFLVLLCGLKKTLEGGSVAKPFIESLLNLFLRNGSFGVGSIETVSHLLDDIQMVLNILKRAVVRQPTQSGGNFFFSATQVQEPTTEFMVGTGLRCCLPVLLDFCVESLFDGI